MGCKLEDASEINDPLTQKLIIQVDPNNRDDIKRGIFKALETSKGLIPDIDSFYYKSFEIRLHGYLDSISARSK